MSNGLQAGRSLRRNYPIETRFDNEFTHIFHRNTHLVQLLLAVHGAESAVIEFAQNDGEMYSAAALSS